MASDCSEFALRLLLGHESLNTTEKYYVAPAKKRVEKGIDARQRMWGADVIDVPATGS
ncbi:MAG: hypothetical protein JO097_10755 [Acidobacteriaceae bacterium]|nr:hypothetical protein [Acidobacteriaceae bacterium]MBV9293972.1 hypothetical protein [Acidobacteriaceae bacterium]MBV9766171.1 hypothetical protein [Acidobacteriaceae bacterium]